MVAWEASPAGVMAQSGLVLAQGFIPAGVLPLAGAAAESSQRHVTGRLQQWVALRQKRQFRQAAATIDYVLLEQPETYDLMQRAQGAFGIRLPNLLLLLTTTAQIAVMLAGYLALLASKSGLIAAVVVLPIVPSV